MQKAAPSRVRLMQVWGGLGPLSGEGELQRFDRITILGEAVIFAEGGDCVAQGEAAVGLHAHGALGQVLSP